MNKLHLDFYDLATRALVDNWCKFMTSKTNKSMFQKFKALEVLHLDMRIWRDNRGAWPASSVAEVISEVQYPPLKRVTVICAETIKRRELSSPSLWVPENLRLLSNAENSSLAEEIRLKLLDYRTRYGKHTGRKIEQHGTEEHGALEGET
jgi:hypothetical protein